MSGYLIGVDVGGTFTDVMLLDVETGAVTPFKVPSTPRVPADGFLHGVDLARAAAGSETTDWHVTHATTIATNAIIEGKTARTALLVTRGFRDILEIARQTRPELFDLFADKPPPLVPRNLCFEVTERLGPDGDVLRDLNETDVEQAVGQMVAEGVAALAVCFLHSYRSPAHEQRAAAIARASNPELWVSLSSDVLPEFREYRRASTTVINAALLPVVAGYLDNVADGLEARGLPRQFHVMQSGGGISTAMAARQRPVEVVESGPAAGVIAAAFFGQQAGFPDVISFDMGGTTAKASLVEHGQIPLAPEIEVGAGLDTFGLAGFSGGTASRGRGYPIGTPSVDLVEIGAGGGSIAWVDDGGLLRVGPRSAGAEPGPACYGLGGTEATVTDADLLLGRLDATSFLGGKMPLDLSAARLAIGRIAQRLGVSEIDAAEGIVDNADAAMVSALHLVSTRRGRDPANFALVAFGGAGPLHAGAAGRQLGAARILIPPHPGTASAYGLLLADLRHELSRTLLQPFGALDYEGIGTILHQLAERGRHALSRDGVPPNATSLLPSLDVRYVGQSFELRIPLTGLELDASAEATAAAHFHAEHHRAYGYAAPDEPIELVNLRLSAIGRRGKPRLPTIDNHVGSIDSALRRSRPVYFDGAWMECPVYIRDRLGAGAVVLGPAVLEEFDSTTIIHPGQTARVDVSGNVLIDPSSGP